MRTIAKTESKILLKIKLMSAVVKLVQCGRKCLKFKGKSSVASSKEFFFWIKPCNTKSKAKKKKKKKKIKTSPKPNSHPESIPS